MNVLSLFDGLSAGQIALNRSGIKYDKYYASEIDKYAIQICQKNYPDTIQLGDVTKWREWDIDFSKIDLLLAGFPCQSWSIAGKQQGNDDPRGKLVHDLIDIWNEIKKHNPDMKFLFENVRMKQGFINYINNLFGVSPIEINSALVSAQNRKRLYWTNIPGTKKGLFSNMIEQPEDKGILLKDIIENGSPDREKSHCLDSCYYKAGASSVGVNEYLNKSRRQLIIQVGKINNSQDGKIVSPDGKSYTLTSGNNNYPKISCIQVGTADLKGNDQIKRVYSPEGKSPSLTTMQGGHQEPKISCGAFRGRYKVDGVRQDGKMKVAGLTTQELELRKDNKTNTLTSVEKDNVLCFDKIPHKTTFIQDKTISINSKKSKTLLAQCGGLTKGIGIHNENLLWRKLTPIECERLQTMPDNYTSYGLDKNYQSMYNGYTNKKELLCKRYVKSKNVINHSQIGKLNSAISTTLDSLELEKLNLKNLLIKAKSVLLPGAIEKGLHQKICASNTISHGKENNLLKKIKSVNFAIRQSDTMDAAECVTDITIHLSETAIHYKWTLTNEENIYHMETGKNIINQKTVDGFIKLLQKEYLTENCKKVKLFIMLTLINLIIAKGIFMSVSQILVTSLYIDSLSQLQENSLEMDLLFLKMENIVKISNSTRYKSIGNSWTVDVICYLLKGLNSDKPKIKSVANKKKC